MKLENFLNHQGLNSLRAAMNAAVGSFDAETTWDRDRLTKEQLAALATTGIDVKIEDVETLEDGTLSYRGERIVLYIRDPYQNMPKFHLCDCRTLEDMKLKKRFDRYVVCTKDDGSFEINELQFDKSRRPRTVRLDVCKNCLGCIERRAELFAKLNLKVGASVETFSLKTYFSVYGKSVFRNKPLYTVDNAPIDEYTDDFPEISSQVRAANNWTCGTCGIVLRSAQLRRYLHVHHENGQKGDNRPENLKVRCLRCHATEPDHARMTYTAEYKSFVAYWESVAKKP